MGKNILHLLCSNKNMKSKECVICGQEECSQEKASFCCLAISTDTWKKKTCLPILFFFIQLLQNVKLINSLGRRDQIWVFLLWTSCPTSWGRAKVVNLLSLRVELNLASSLLCVTALQCGLVAKGGCCCCSHYSSFHFVWWSQCCLDGLDVLWAELPGQGLPKACLCLWPGFDCTIVQLGRGRAQLPWCHSMGTGLSALRCALKAAAGPFMVMVKEIHFV